MNKKWYEEMTQIHLKMGRLLWIQSKIEALDQVKKKYSNVIPISQSTYDTLLHNNGLIGNAIYYVLTEDVGQYVDGYIK